METSSTRTKQFAKKNFVPGTSRQPRSFRTFALQMALSLEKKAEMGARIKDLRERHQGHAREGKQQQRAADFCKVTLRAYQAWEYGESEPDWDHAQLLGQYFDRTPEFILYGPTEVEEVLQEDNTRDQLNRLEEKVDLIHLRLEALWDYLVTELPETVPAQHEVLLPSDEETQTRTPSPSEHRRTPANASRQPRQPAR